MAHKKPTHLKILGGEKRPCRLNANEPKSVNAIAEAPEWLSERASEVFAKLSAILLGMGISSPDDETMLAILASRIEEIERLTLIIEDLGHTYQSESGLFKARPEVGMRNEAMRHAQSLLGEFGLSPATRARVSASTPEAENPFAHLTGN